LLFNHCGGGSKNNKGGGFKRDVRKNRRERTVLSQLRAKPGMWTTTKDQLTFDANLERQGDEKFT